MSNDVIRPISGAVSGLWADDPRWLLAALDERRTREQVGWESPRRYLRGSEAGEMCLIGPCGVYTPTGLKEIRVLVKNRYAGPVLTVLADGSIGERRVIGWHKAPREGKELLRIEFTHRSPNNTRGRAGGRVVVTEDHLFLTPCGWIPAQELGPRVLVATGGYAPNLPQAEVLDGCLLGDGHFDPQGRYQSTQLYGEYPLRKEEMLSSLGSRGNTITRAPPRKPQRRMRMPVSLWGRQERARWYPDGKKIVPRDLSLTPRVLAVWYMDDGCKQRQRVQFATCAFSLDDVLWLSHNLKVRGMDNTVRVRDGYPRIFLTREGTRRLMYSIGSFVSPEMRYKLTQDAPPFDPSVWLPQAPALEWDSVRVSSPTEADLVTSASVYCIDVEDTHNFITRAGVVHNCVRCLCLSAMGHRIVRDPRLGRIFAIGKAVEAINERLMGRAEILDNVQVPVAVGGHLDDEGRFVRDEGSGLPPILGHADMVVERPIDGRRFIIEWKTINSNGWSKLPPEHGPTAAHKSPLTIGQYRAVAQVSLYAWGLAIEDSLLVFENKDTSAQRAYWLTESENMAAESLFRFAEAAPYILSDPQRVPPRQGRSNCRNYLCRRLPARGATYEEARMVDARLRGSSDKGGV